MDVVFDVAHGIQMVSMLYKDDDVSISKKTRESKWNNVPPALPAAHQ
jgi:hypothetical protein